MDLDFDLFEAICGITGEFGNVCEAYAPLSAVLPGVELQHPDELPCTRMANHAGDHVAAHTDGRMLARWPVCETQPCR